MSTPSAADLAKTLSRYTYRFSCEAELQESIAQVLEQEAIRFAREVRINPRERLDFLCGSTAVEVKIRGSLSDLTRQVHGYLADDRIDELLVVTSRSRLCDLPLEIRGKPVRALCLRNGA